MTSELKVNRKYLDTKFEGYRIDTADLCRFSREIPGVLVEVPNPEQFSFLQHREYSLHNHLHYDPWCSNSVYVFTSEFLILKFRVTPQADNDIEGPTAVWEVPFNQGRENSFLNVSICLASEDIAVVSDGGGFLHILATGDRKQSSGFWKELHSERLDNFVRLADARYINQNELHVICRHVDTKQSYVTHLFFKCVGESSWKLEKSTTLFGKGSIDFAALDPECKYLYVIGQIEVKTQEYIDAENNKPPEKPKEISYEWQQSFEEIKIWVKTDRKAKVSVKALELVITANDGHVLLQGRFKRAVEDAVSVWEYVQREGGLFLELTVTKREEGTMWTDLFESSDFYGKEVPNPQVAAEIHSKLAHLTSDTEDVGGATVLNSSQLEECDITDGEGRLLVQYDLSSTLVPPINKIQLGNGQWLMEGARRKHWPPRFCIRSDVDGIVWELDGKSLTHVATLCAFGFVQASKTSRLFSFFPTDASYGGLVDSDGRVFIYRNGVRPLNNEAWGTQYIVQLGKMNIVGAHATKSYVFILSDGELHVIKLPS